MVPIADGVYSIQYTLATASPEYVLTIDIQAGGLGPASGIAGSPFKVAC